MRALLISNPHSTTHSSGGLDEIVRALRSVSGLSLRAQFTAYPGHAREMVRGLRRKDFDYIVSIGGDGTVNEIIDGLLDGNPFSAPAPEQLPVVCIVPTGGANVLAGSLGIPRSARSAAWYLADAVRRGQSTTISVGRAGDRCFVVNTGVGIDGAVIAIMEGMRSGGASATALGYLPAIYRAWQDLLRNPPRISVTVDGTVLGTDLPVAIVSNANPWTYFGDIPVTTNPGLSRHFGLGVYALTSFKGLTGLVTAANLAGGLLPLRGIFQVAQRELRVDNATQVQLRSDRPLHFQIDGEYVDRRNEVEVSVCAEGIRVTVLSDEATLERQQRLILAAPFPQRMFLMWRQRVRARRHRGHSG